MICSFYAYGYQGKGIVCAVSSIVLNTDRVWKGAVSPLAKDKGTTEMDNDQRVIHFQ